MATKHEVLIPQALDIGFNQTENSLDYRLKGFNELDEVIWKIIRAFNGFKRALVGALLI